MAEEKRHWKAVLAEKRKELPKAAPSSSVAVTRGRSIGRPDRPRRRRTAMPVAIGMPRHIRKYLEEEGLPESCAVQKGGLWVVRRNAPDSYADGGPTGPTNQPPKRPPSALPEPPWSSAVGKGLRFTGPCESRHGANDWMKIGIGSQIVSNQKGRQRAIRVVMGLDFGTAYTKVVANIANDRYAVPFDKVVTAGHPFLVPTVLSVDASGQAYLGRHFLSVEVVEDLKLHLLEAKESDRKDEHFVAYMALVIRASRAWLFEHHGKTLARAEKIDWGYNLGIPTVPWEDEGFRRRYLTLLEAARRVSECDKPVTIVASRTALTTVRGRTTPLAERIGVFAEFAAQITGYVKSPRLQRGPHLLVDVGAGTLDVTMFSVLNADDLEAIRVDDAIEMVSDSSFPIWDAQVQPLGTYYLAAARALGLNGAASRAVAPVDDRVEELDDLCARTGAHKAELESLETQFEKYVAACVARVIRKTKVERYPRLDWGTAGVPTFVCGGGGRYRLYPSAVERAASGFPVKLDLVPLPVPDTLRRQGVDDSFFDRLSVAYGLSYEPQEIGEIKPSWLVPNQPPRPVRQSGPTEYDPTDKAQSQ